MLTENYVRRMQAGRDQPRSGYFSDGGEMLKRPETPKELKNISDDLSNRILKMYFTNIYISIYI